MVGAGPRPASPPTGRFFWSLDIPGSGEDGFRVNRKRVRLFCPVLAFVLLSVVGCSTRSDSTGLAPSASASTPIVEVTDLPSVDAVTNLLAKDNNLTSDDVLWSGSRWGSFTVELPVDSATHLIVGFSCVGGTIGPTVTIRDSTQVTDHSSKSLMWTRLEDCGYGDIDSAKSRSLTGLALRGVQAEISAAHSIKWTIVIATTNK